MHVTWILAALGAILCIGVAYQLAGLLLDRRHFPAPGKLIDVDGQRFHAHIMGPPLSEKASTPVVFEAGIGATSLSWRLVQSEIAKTRQTISYDRAGLGWSDSRNTPRDLDQLVEELRTLLNRTGAATPRILVAHSFGGLVAVHYASRYPQELAGIVLVDPVSPSEWAQPSARSVAMLRRGAALARFGQLLAYLGLVRFALMLASQGARTAPKLIARATSGRGGQAFTERMVGQIRKLPPEVWPMIQAHWCDPKCFRTIARQLAMLPECATAAAKLGQIETPLVLLSANGEAELARFFPHSRVEVIPNSGHWIQLDQPQTVICAIRELDAGL
jgi:pimeloyl-ACP methyl ester carboxylesterase